eukprot:scaffold3289_cov163-Amphora_coffeaeformis.AAC.4
MAGVATTKPGTKTFALEVPNDADRSLSSFACVIVTTFASSRTIATIPSSLTIACGCDDVFCDDALFLMRVPTTNKKKKTGFGSRTLKFEIGAGQSTLKLGEA